MSLTNGRFTPVCQAHSGEDEAEYVYGLGELSTQMFADYPHGADKGVSIHYSGGSACPDSSQRNTRLNIRCDASEPSPGKIVTITEDPERSCNYVIEMVSPHACPKV
eukprot:TRINITY_DN15313_c0_g1_i1.p1 TRINITY_DN15313_c0_g1~~TRINITY_DN15313_c0_g1_i1.p1  ORF type:complete len:107 (+),score=13.50 TRINITY_DN15313_c0_g1_i1:297-617(+)